MDFAQFVGKGFGPAWRGILFRKQYPDLDEIIIKSSKYYRRIFPNAIYNKGDHRWVFPDGEQLLFRYGKNMDDYWNYHGHEFPWLGFDELSLWPNDEFYIAMRTCCRSSVPGMPRRLRAACNPYGVGHNWVKARFIDPAPRGVIVTDDVCLERVTIHGSIWENIILLQNDPAYLLMLKSQTGARRKAWLEGDWDIVAGGMFDDVWDPRVHVIQPFEIPASWRIDRSFDWGSSKPYSVGIWAESDGTDIELPDGLTRATQRGDLFRIAEIYGWTGKPNEGTRELATQVARKILIFQKELGRLVNPGPADTSIFTVENGNSIAGDMEKIGVRWNRANMKTGSRINGWELLRQRFENSVKKEGPGIYVFDTCRQFIRTVPVLPRDSRQSDDVDSNAEDHCLDGDTLVVTTKGEKPIKELVGTKGLVMTAGGYFTEYKNCRLTRKNTEVFRVIFEDDSFIICTGDHKILTSENQWKEIKEWKSKSYQPDDKNFKVSRIICADFISKEKVSDFIAKSGNVIMEQSQKDSMSTILTVTEQTTTSKILNSFNRGNILKSIMPKAIATKIYQKLMRRHAYGMEVKKESIGTKNNTKNIVPPPYERKLRKIVGIAARNSLGAFAHFTAQIIASLHIDARRGRIISSANVLSAEKSLSLVNTIQTKPVHDVVVQSLGIKQVDEAGFADVYCLDANLTHCFVLSNGIIVHNCADEVRYRVLERRHTITVRQAS